MYSVSINDCLIQLATKTCQILSVPLYYVEYIRQILNVTFSG
jgi:hypothetical protein